MNEEYDRENGGQREVSEAKRSRWHISADTRNLLAVFFGTLVLFSTVWGVCEYALARLDAKFDEIGVRFDRQERRMDRIESALAEGFRQTHGRIDRTDARIDRIESKVDAIDAFLRQGRQQVPVEGDGATPVPDAKPEGSRRGSSWPLPRDR